MNYNPELNEEHEENYIPGRDGHVLLIDCSKRMFAEKKFHESFEIIESMLRNLIIKSEKNMLGVLFYNTEKSPLPMGSKETSATVDINNIAVFLDMQSVCADTMKLIHRYKDNEINDFPIVYGHCETNAGCLNDALWFAAKMLRTCGYKLKESRILLLTDNATPFEPDSSEERNAFKKAEDLRDSGVTVTLVPMSDTFSGEPFYTQFIATVCDVDVSQIQEDLKNPSQKREHLLLRLFKKEFTKCVISRIKFHLGEGLDMSVGLYSMHREAKPPKQIIINRSDKEIVQAKRVATVVEVHEDPDRNTVPDPTVQKDANINPVHIIPTEMKKYQEIGGEKVVFTMREFNNLKRVMEPGVILLGFKPMSTFVLGAHLRGPNFMYPDESILKGSTTLFRALWEKCLEKEKVAYAIIVERNLANPKLVVLVPQEEQTGKYYRYSGFRVEYIPYADSIRDIDAYLEAPLPEIPDGSTDLFKDIIRKLRFRYSPEQFSNPVVHNLYDVIEATVLEETPPQAYDLTLPDDALQDEKMGDLIKAFDNMFGTDSSVTVKRGASSGGSARPPKIAKTFDTADVQKAYDNDTLGTFTVDDLKAYLKQSNVNTALSKLKKGELIELVKEVIKNQALSSVPLP